MKVIAQNDKPNSTETNSKLVQILYCDRIGVQQMDLEISRLLLGLDGVLYSGFCCDAIGRSRWLLSCYVIAVVRENGKESQ